VGKGAGKKITKIIGLGKKKPSIDEQTSSAEEDVPTCGKPEDNEQTNCNNSFLQKGLHALSHGVCIVFSGHSKLICFSKMLYLLFLLL